MGFSQEKKNLKFTDHNKVALIHLCILQIYVYLTLISPRIYKSSCIVNFF